MINQQTVKDNNINIIDSDKTLGNDKAVLIEKLKALLPSVINADNQLDTKALSDVVDMANTTSNNQGYELTFAGKGIARALADSPTKLELKTELGQSKDFDNTDNVVIRGDNLEVLKILQANYHQKIKMIYIDPPYNTKNENFIYKDNFKKSDEQLIEDFHLDEEAKDFLHNVYGTRSHSGWLSFIYPRLKLARDLLTDDGVIFISIDDNEQANLKILCDEIFGADNFIECICWNKRIPKNDKGVGNIHEYILLYVKNSSFKHKFLMEKSGIDDVFNLLKKLKKKGVPMLEAEREIKKMYKKNAYDRGITLYDSLDSDYHLWGKINMSWPNQDTFGDDYKILHPKTNKAVKVPDRGWRWKRETFNNVAKIVNGVYTEIKKLHDGSLVCGGIWFANDENTQPSSIKYLNDVKDFLLRSVISTKSDGGVEIESLFNHKSYFSRPKPTSLISTFIESVPNSQNDIILDFFAGSGTTGDAVMQLNAEDGGKRKFVLVQIDEPIIKKKSAEAYKFCTDNQFKPVISSITIERLNRAGEKINNDFAEKSNDMFNDKKLPDIGYKVFSCTKKPTVKHNEDNQQEVFGVVNNRANTLDTLVNMLVATCKTLDIKVTCLIENKLYQADDEIYLLDNIASEKLAKYQDFKINLDGWADIDLTAYLNLGIGQKDNISVIY
jgi:adenine-specific DNA-methyltransferase